MCDFETETYPNEFIHWSLCTPESVIQASFRKWSDFAIGVIASLMSFIVNMQEEGGQQKTISEKKVDIIMI